MLDTDLDEYLTEYRLQTPTEPTVHYEGMYKYIRFIILADILIK